MTITPARIERLLAVGAMALLTAESGCLVHLWAYVDDSSGESSLTTAGVLLLLVPLAMAIVGRALRIAGRVAGRSGRLPFSAAENGNRPDFPLGVGILLAGLCALAAMPSLLLAKWVTDWLAGTMVWTRTSWLAAGLAVRGVFLTPMAVGLAMGMRAVTGGARPKAGDSGEGRETPIAERYALAFGSRLNELVAGTAGGLAILAAAWWAGANLLGLALAIPVLLLAAGGAAMVRPARAEATLPDTTGTPPASRGKKRAARPGAKSRRGTKSSPPDASLPHAASPLVPRRVSIWLAYAALAAGAAVQDRLATDVMGLAAGPRLAWTALTLLLFLAFLREEDRPPAPARASRRGDASAKSGRAKEVGGAIGLAAVFLMQCSMAILTLDGGAAGVFCVLLAVAMQLPLCALAAGVLSRQRRAHASGGGAARAYVGGACGGAGAGLLLLLPAGWMSGGTAGLVGAALGVMAWGACREIFLCPRRADQARWAAVGAGLLVSVAAGLLLAVREAGRTVGAVRPGVWLSVALPAEGSGTGDAGQDGTRACGLLPGPRPVRSGAITAAMAEWLARPASKGNWSAAISCSADLPEELPKGVSLVLSSPDPSAIAAVLEPRRATPPPGRTWGAGLEGAFLQASRAGRGRYDGAILAPIPADHPEAWRCYNTLALRRAAERVRPGGTILLRTQAREGEAAAILATAHSFLDVVGSGWAAVAIQDGWLDMLLVGPADDRTHPAPPAALHMANLKDLLAAPFDVPAIDLSHPAAYRRSRLPEGGLTLPRSADGGREATASSPAGPSRVD